MEYAFRHVEALLDWFIETDGNMDTMTSGTLLLKCGPNRCDLSQVLGFVSDFAGTLYALKSAQDFTSEDPLHMDIPTRCLALCAAMWSRNGRHEPEAKHTFTVLTSELLKTSIICASSLKDNAIPWHVENLQGWEVQTSHLDWLVKFLDVLHGGDSTLVDSEVWDATAHALLVISSLKNLSTHFDNRKLIRALDWALQVPWSGSGSSTQTTDPLYGLHYSTLSLIHALIESRVGPPLHERYGVLKTNIQGFPSSWCSLEAAIVADDSNRDKEFVRVVASVAKSDPHGEDAWINEADNEVCVRYWISAVGRRVNLKDVWKLVDVKAYRLLSCNVLFNSTEPYWQSQQVRRVAMAALYIGWFGRSFLDLSHYSEEFLCARTLRLISSEFWKTQDQDMLESEWLIEQMLFWMQDALSKSKSERLHELTDPLEAKLESIRDFKASLALP